MATKLRDNLTSAYMSAANRLNSRRARRKIIAYVESYDDIAFWRSLLGEFETDRFFFEIMLPSQTSLAKGKKMALMNVMDADAFGEDMIACVDSDYDYLMQGRTPVSKRMMESPYIFQTYAYAIENHLCYAEGLHQVCVEATLNDREVMDLPGFMAQYSRIVYPLFLWNIWFYRAHDTNTFPMSELHQCTSIHHFSLQHPEEALQQVEKRVGVKLRALERKMPGKVALVKALREELRPLGLTPETTYLYMQGHHIMDNVVLKVLWPVCTLLRREREEDIKRLAQHSKQYANELSGYRNSQVEVDFILRRNYGYRDLWLYGKIRDDVRNFVNNLE
jgi:hypothetical protein